MRRQTNNFAQAVYAAILPAGAHGCILVMLPPNDFYSHSVSIEKDVTYHINIIMLTLLINMDIYIIQGCG